MRVFCFAFLIIIIQVFVCKAQIQSDAGMWNTFTIEKEFSKKITVGIDQELRLRDNYSRLNLFYTNLSIDYKIKKGFKISIGYRLVNKYLKEGYLSYRNRLMLDATYKYKYNNFILNYRSRVQAEVRDYYSSELGKFPEWYWRNKFDLKYDFNNFTPYVGTEFRYQIHDPRNPVSDKGFHRSRVYAGIDYEINKSNTFGIYYLNQQEFNIEDPNIIHIIGLKYAITLLRSE
jgi:hypothetical protein